MLSALKDGCSLADSAGLAGVEPATLSNECKRDKEFDAAVRKAELEGKRTMLKDVKKRKPEFLLERKYWREFARRTPENITLAQVVSLLTELFSVVFPHVKDESKPIVMDALENVLDKAQIAAGKLNGGHG